jgi:hypothetical protein
MTGGGGMTGETSFPAFLAALERIAQAHENISEQLGTVNRNLEAIAGKLVTVASRVDTLDGDLIVALRRLA